MLEQRMLYIPLTVSVGLMGACIAKKTQMPAAMMTGSLIAVILLNLLTGNAYLPLEIKPAVQAIAGGAIGVSIGHNSLAGLKKILWPVLVYVLSLIMLASTAAVIIVLLTPLSPVTALLSCAPGGIVDMSILSYDFNANTSHVIILQMTRLVIALGVFPSLTQAYLKKFDRTNETPIEPDTSEATIIEKKATADGITATLIILSVGGFVGYISGLPAGALSCSMISVAVYQIKYGKAHMPQNIKKIAQIAAGAIIGATMTISDLKGLYAVILPFFIILAEFLILNYILGPLIAKIFHIDLTTILLACTPAGVSDMALVAGDMGGDQAKVAVFQIVRLTSVLIIFPFLAQLFALWSA